MKRELTMKKKRMLFGYALMIPFLTGFILFFLQPLVLSFIYSINNIRFVLDGTEYVKAGLEYYKSALTIDVDFRNALIESMQNLLVDVPVIVFLSLFIATILNNKFYGRTAARLVLFLPVIITTGVLLQIESTDYLMGVGAQTLQTGSESSAVYEPRFFDIRAILMSLNLPTQVLTYIQMINERFYNIIIASGVQITILLAALQSIPSSLYEASSIEGASAWENFWKITLPMVSPYVFVCALYTIIDTFTSPTNVVINYIREISFGRLDYSLASAMSWIYFVIIAIILGLVSWLLLGSKVIVYQDK